MVAPVETSVLNLLILKEDTRHLLLELFQKNNYPCSIVTDCDGLLEGLKGRTDCVIFIDSGASIIYGTSLYSKIRRTCSGSRIILLCEQSHRELIRSAMEQGVYACVLEPYPEWEIITMLRPILAEAQSKRRKAGKKSPP
jgi:DNA-binding NtrC family response regulator